MYKQPQVFVLLLMMFWVSASQATDMYKWMDEEGNVHFGDKPPPKDAAEKETINKNKLLTGGREYKALPKGTVFDGSKHTRMADGTIYPIPKTDIEMSLFSTELLRIEKMVKENPSLMFGEDNISKNYPNLKVQKHNKTLDTDISDSNRAPKGDSISEQVPAKSLEELAAMSKSGQQASDKERLRREQALIDLAKTNPEAALKAHVARNSPPKKSKTEDGTLPTPNLTEGEIAQLTELKSYMNHIQASYYQFIDRNRHIPGDWEVQGAAAKIEGVMTGGNNDGKINIDGGQWVETLAAWEHLSKAGLIKGDFTGGDKEPAANSSDKAPRNPFGGLMFLLRTDSYVQISGLISPRMLLVLGKNIPVDILRQLDIDMDDGKPHQGDLRLSTTTGSHMGSLFESPAECLHEERTDYDTRNETALCNAVYLF